MNARSTGLLLSKALDGFQNFKLAEAASLGTLRGYCHDLKHFLKHIGDRDVSDVTPDLVRDFLGWLRTGYTPIRFGGATHPLSPKTLRNYWIALSSLFAWLNREFGYEDIMSKVPAPKFKRAPVETFSREQIEALLKAAEYSKEVQPDDRRKYRMRRSTGKRDAAIILTLLDTGMRATELCMLKIGDVDLKTGRMQIKHGVTGGAKGGKGRTVFMGKTGRKAVWMYLVGREDEDDADAPLFLGKFEHKLNNVALLHLIKSLGERAGVTKCHPHRFRHYAEFRTMPSKKRINASNSVKRRDVEVCKSQCKRGPFTNQNGTHLSGREKKQQPEMGPSEHKGEGNASQIGTHLLTPGLSLGARSWVKTGCQLPHLPRINRS